MSCNVCKYWNNLYVKPPGRNDNRFKGECRRYPIFTITLDDYWCGEFHINREGFTQRLKIGAIKYERTSPGNS